MMPHHPLALVHRAKAAIDKVASPLCAARRMAPPRLPLLLLAAAALAGCAASDPAPDWQVNARGGVERALAAYLRGDTRAEAAEWALARREMARTGRPEQVARVELNRCAARVASLDFAPCAAFEPLRVDAPAPERAYADYLAGQLAPADAALLPAQHQAVARGAAPPPAAQLAAIDDPLARLVAAGVLLRQSRAQPDVVALAVDTASAQGWRRPLLAWLGVAQRLAAQRGDHAEADRLRRRMDLVEPAGPARAASAPVRATVPAAPAPAPVRVPPTPAP